ncbi:MAG: hypothetical protein A2287_08695 [Candidatus Melainabacteria bacterium RIFOXYA12_FULL_32_12]|nr:MAG: hypothetical protein A2104_10190 [Candidatus Melainabacteria bacterium GWF2_32_7]OGI21627.1 MAG: hypothetical protein A2255_01400 [Candidatus Melainabacteria bacterium RIFOXYA2_FULL_32_9]OGI30458.1 MAG: hypothetical protein A2287_08695 [Candidatus Melainabacteria bacterium RIFOXYA12_FULL_32_12]
MDFSLLIQTFLLVFVAEMGDKTQLATINLAAKGSTLSVFIGASLALVTVTLIGALAGKFIGQYIPTFYMNKIAAVAFITIGILMLLNKI